MVSNDVTDCTPFSQLFYLGHAKLETKGQFIKETIYSSPSSKAHSKIHEKHS
jgi:hypothetical protein